MDDKPESMSDEPMSTPDNAPWWVKELRIYGISALCAVAFGWFAWTVYQNSRTDAKDANAKTAELADKAYDVIGKANESNNKLATGLQENKQAVQSLTDAIKQSQANSTPIPLQHP